MGVMTGVYVICFFQVLLLAAVICTPRDHQ